MKDFEMDKKTIWDILICDKCSSDMEIYDTDEIEFSDDMGVGHYRFNCWCPNCNNHERKTMRFKYEII